LSKPLHTRAAAPAKILLLRLSSIGDVVLVTPVLRNLRQCFPHAAIAMVVKEEFADLVRHHPGLTTIHAVPSKPGWSSLLKLGRELHDLNYEVVIDLHRNFRTALLGRLCGTTRRLRYPKPRLRRWLYVRFKINTMAQEPPVAQRYLQALAPLGVPGDSIGTEIFWTPQHETEATAALQGAGWRVDQPLLGFAPGAGYFTKRWPAEYFAALAARLLENNENLQLAILGGAQDREAAQLICRHDPARVLDLTGRCSLLASAAIVKRCQLLVSNDSGLLHIAEAVHTPLVAIFGSTTRALGFFPQFTAARVIENHGLACRPCSHLGYRACPRGHFRCMRELTPEMVVAEIGRLLAPRARSN